jgi:hypothetical protein
VSANRRRGPVIAFRTGRPIVLSAQASRHEWKRENGTLGGIVTLLVWVWISNLALLFGAELNAERERTRELAADVPRAEREIQLEPRDEPDDKQTT